MYFINVYDKTTQRHWKETFDSYYFFKKKCLRIEHSKNLVIVSRSNYEVE